MVYAQGKEDGVLLISGAKNLKDPELVEQALNNQKGGVLQAYKASDGSLLGEYPLGSMPVYDGLSVSSSGYVLLAQKDGHLLCMKAE